MAYVVTRPKGRFEIRESVHTAKGPRARSLANFAHLNDEVLERARRRASRPFDAHAVRAAAVRAAHAATADAADAADTAATADAAPARARRSRPERRQFIEASRRMASSLERPPRPAARQDPGDALIDLLGFVAQIKALRPPPTPEPLTFPPLARLREEREARDRAGPSVSGGEVR
ncbi:MAG TPA: hypothetical protein VGL48_04385 [Acidimicrobiales bacterium]